MIRCETAVIRWMPVFRGKNQIKLPLQLIGKRDDLITVRHRQRATRQKIILKINNDERVHYVCIFLCERVRLSPFVKGRGLR